jgi:hypothetical protein
MVMNLQARARWCVPLWLLPARLIQIANSHLFNPHPLNHCNNCLCLKLAGRGPLVRSSIAAARATRRKLRVYAVEKNPAAIVHIQRMVRCEGWQEVVTIVHQDMRDWTPPEKVSAMSSEA